MPDVIRMKGRIALSAGLALPLATAGVWLFVAGARGVQPAFHIVYASAQPEAGQDGLHLQFLDKRTILRYLDLACKNGLLVFLDIQIGRSDVETEMRDILPYLEAPNVHVALDPEFAMAAGQR